MKQKLKLYVWEDVCSDYTSGVMFALAPSVDKARSLLLKKSSSIPAGDLAQKPKCITTQKGFVVWGGG
ncbi:hypothetical protein ACFLQL_00805 [Verrucomicrobiota bacterium]